MSKVSKAVDAAVDAIAAQIDHLSASTPLTDEQARQLTELTRVLATIENSRVSAVVSLLVGRKRLEDLSPNDFQGLLKALTE